MDRNALLEGVLARARKLHLNDEFDIFACGNEKSGWSIENGSQRLGWDSLWLTPVEHWANANNFTSDSKSPKEPHATFASALDVLDFWQARGEIIVQRLRDGYVPRVDEAPGVLPYTVKHATVMLLTPAQLEMMPTGARLSAVVEVETWCRNEVVTFVKGVDPTPTRRFGEMMACGIGKDAVIWSGTLTGCYW
jgi:hypothetical protein